MLNALAWTAIAWAVAVVWVLHARVRPLTLAPLVVAMFHVVVLQGCVFAAGLLGALNGVGLWTGTGICASAAALSCALRPVAIGREWRRWWRAGRRCDRIGARVALTGVVIFAGLSGVIGFLAGPFVGDALRGYLLPPADWVAYGRIFDVGWTDPVGYRPQGHGLLVAMWMVGTGLIRSANLAGLHWMCVLWTAVWALARQSGASGRTAGFAVLATLAIPILWAMSTSGLSDLPVAAATVAGLACVVGPVVRPVHLLLTLLAVMIGLGAKYSMIAPGAMVIVVGILRYRRQAARLRPHRVAFMRSRSPLAIAAALAGLMTGYWYAANVWRFGNPVFPWTSGGMLFGRRTFTPGSYLMLRIRMHFDLFWERFWDRRGFYNATTPYGTGLGTLAAAMGWPALITRTVVSRAFRPLGLATLALFYAMILLGAPPQVWVGRFFAFLGPILAVSAVGLVPKLPGGVWRWAWVLMCIGAGAWGVRVGVGHLAHGEAWQQWRQEGLGYARTLPFEPEIPDGLLLGLDAIPRHATVAVLDSNSDAYLLTLHRGAPTRRFIYYRPAREAGAGSVTPGRFGPLSPRLIDRWRAWGVGYIAAPEAADARTLEQAAPPRSLRKIAEGLYAIQ